MLAASDRPLADTVVQQLQRSAPQDVQELLPALQERGEAYAHDAIQQLTQRGAAEARAMQDILQTQRRHIAATISKHEKMDHRQLLLDFGDNEDERRQLEANKRYWYKRLEELGHELQREPGRIQDLYTVKATRIEPVGLVYLWPLTG